MSEGLVLIDTNLTTSSFSPLRFVMLVSDSPFGEGQWLHSHTDISPHSTLLSQRYFFPAATTLCLNTGLPSFPSTLANGLMIAFIQISNTSPKNARIASSVCGLVGLFGIDVLEDDEDRLAVVVEAGVEV